MQLELTYQKLGKSVALHALQGKSGLQEGMDASEADLRKLRQREYHKKWYLKNRDRVLRRASERSKIPEVKLRKNAYVKLWRSKNKDKVRRYYLNRSLESVRASQKRWRKKNLAKRAQYAREWRQKYPDYYYEYRKEWRNRSRGIIAVGRHKYKSRRLNAYVEDNSVDGIIIQWKSRPDFKCYYCGVVFEIGCMHVEHRIPFSRGGKHSLDNICQSCPKCNHSKRSKTDVEFIEWRKSQCVSP